MLERATTGHLGTPELSFPYCAIIVEISGKLTIRQQVGLYKRAFIPYQPRVCSMCASSSAAIASPFIAPVRFSLTSSNTLGSL